MPGNGLLACKNEPIEFERLPTAHHGYAIRESARRGGRALPGAPELKPALAALGRARRQRAKVGQSYAAGTATVDDVEVATVELMQPVQSVERPMRRMLLAIKIHYAS